jgi:hypothetical protein
MKFGRLLIRLLVVASLVDNIIAGSLSGHDIIVETDYLDYGFRRFPVVFHNEDGPRPGFATLGIIHDDYSVVMFADLRRHRVLEDVDSWSLETSEGSGGSITVPTSMVVIDLFGLPGLQTAIFAASFRSRFLEIARSFILTPKNLTNGQLIINPLNASRYAFEEQIYYASSLDEARLRIPVAIKVIPPPSRSTDSSSGATYIVSRDDFHSCVIDDPSNGLWVPNSVYVDLFNQLDSLGIHHLDILESNQLSVTIVYNVTEENIGLLPSLQFMILTDDDQVVSIQGLGPWDYIAPERAVEAGGGRPLMLRTGTAGWGCTLSSKLINRMMVHIDGENARIGFGEPLDEI